MFKDAKNHLNLVIIKDLSKTKKPRYLIMELC